MNRSEIIAYRRRRLLELADELGNVSAACRQMDVDRARYYEWKRLAEQDGVEALSPKPPGRPRSSVPLPPEAVEELLAMAIIDPMVGCAEYASRLSALGHLVSKTTVQEILQEHGLRHRNERIARAGAASNGAGFNGELRPVTERSASKLPHPEAFVPLPEMLERDDVAKTNGTGKPPPSATAIDSYAAGPTIVAPHPNGQYSNTPPVALSSPELGVALRTATVSPSSRLAAALRAITSRVDLLIQAALLVPIAWVTGTNMFHWPGPLFDEGTYVSEAWAISKGVLAPYTYSYGHPPLGWVFIFFWTVLTGIFGHPVYSVDTGRQFMFVVNLVSCVLVYELARRMKLGRFAAASAVILFSLSPLAVFFHRGVLIDNPSIAWALGAFVLAYSPRHRLWAFAGSGACFAAAVFCKETTLIMLPALAVAVFLNTDSRTKRYCLSLFAAFFVLIGSAYPLFAALKGELFPGKGHVSLVGYEALQLFGRQGTGSIFNVHSQTYVIVTQWLKLDPWLLVAGLVLSPIALARRSTRPMAIAFLLQALILLRAGYLPNMFVLGLLPFAALIVVGGLQAISQRFQRLTRGTFAELYGAPVFLASICVLAIVAGSFWVRTDRAAMTQRLDGPTLAAERWVATHIGHNQRLLVDDTFWVYLIQHGFDHQPMKGGFFSNDVVFFFELDRDPAVEHAFPQGWRDFNYVIESYGMYVSLSQTPGTARAVAHSRVVKTFGRGIEIVRIRAIEGSLHPTRPIGTSGAHRQSRHVPRAV